MDSRRNESYADLPSVETPEDVAVLYSWANLHGAKYRDFSASRREYRAQLRHRAAEQARDTEHSARVEAEVATEQAMIEVREAEAQALAAPADAARIDSLRLADAAAQRAAAERIEAARHADAVEKAEIQVRSEEREIVAAHASEQRNQAIYLDNLARNLDMDQTEPQVPGTTADPYTPSTRQPLPQEIPSSEQQLTLPPARSGPEAMPARSPYPAESPAALQPGDTRSQFVRTAAPGPIPVAPPAPARRPQGYRPDDASGVRQIYRPDAEPPHRKQMIDPSARPDVSRAIPAASVPPYARRETTLPPPSPPPIQHAPAAMPSGASPATGQRELVAVQGNPAWKAAPALPPATAFISTPEYTGPDRRAPAGPPFLERRRATEQGDLADPVPRRRRQDQPGFRVTDSDRAMAAYRREQGQALPTTVPPPVQAAPIEPQALPEPPRPQEPPRSPEPVLPAWIHEQPAEPRQASPAVVPPPEAQPPAEFAAETLQRSRERVAARWYALKGVFDHSGQELAEPPPQRQREIRTPVLAVFSFAGGVGKTSLVATLGRSLSSLGEKVLLTDTTSHGLLPFYFGASELREGTVRTFSPPSGSTDAPISLVNYAVDQAPCDEATQESVVNNIIENGRGAHRVLLDLTTATSWLIRRIAPTTPTVLVPLAPDMNSVISLQSIERFLKSIDGPDGTPLKVFYVLNQFDAGLPLHLDVREVLRRQLGERLLPIVIRRAPAVSEALAEGMTIIDYATDAPVTEDYFNVAQWLRALAAPATAGFRNVRWSER